MAKRKLGMECYNWREKDWNSIPSNIIPTDGKMIVRNQLVRRVKAKKWQADRRVEPYFQASYDLKEASGCRHIYPNNIRVKI